MSLSCIERLPNLGFCVVTTSSGYVVEFKCNEINIYELTDGRYGKERILLARFHVCDADELYALTQYEEMYRYVLEALEKCKERKQLMKENYAKFREVLECLKNASI